MEPQNVPSHTYTLVCKCTGHGGKNHKHTHSINKGDPKSEVEFCKALSKFSKVHEERTHEPPFDPKNIQFSVHKLVRGRIQNYEVMRETLPVLFTNEYMHNLKMIYDGWNLNCPCHPCVIGIDTVIAGFAFCQGKKPKPGSISNLRAASKICRRRKKVQARKTRST